jgi:hypothetical protein
MVVPGVVMATYAGRMWYMNSPSTLRARLWKDYEQTSRVIFAAPDNFEDLDWSPDGDWFDLPSNIGGNSPILGAQGTDRALIIFKREETIAVTGRTPSEFTPDVILNDGILHPTAYAPYKNGVVWAGQQDVYYYDGQTIHSLVRKKLGDFYPQLVEGVTAGSAHDHLDKNCTVTAERDHVFIYIDNADPARDVVKVATAESPDQLTLVINMTNGSIGTWKNAAFRASFSFNEATGRDTYIVSDDLVHGEGAGADGSVVFSLNDVFETAGAADDITAEGMVAGPDFYVETKRWSANSEFIKKKLKRFRVQYTSTGGTMVPETIVGKERGNVTGVATSTLAASTTFAHKDILMTPILSEWIGFRFYEGASVSDASLGELMFTYKTHRSTRTY